MAKLRGAFTALITPMHADGAIDYEGFRSLLRYQLDNGITGVLPLGTTAETPTLEEVGEEDTLIDIAVEEVAAYRKKQNREIPLIIGAGSNNTAEAIRYVTRAKNKGADYALVVSPYFRHYEAISKIGIPIIVYNIAGRTGKNISTALLQRIVELPNIAGVKEASGDINQMMDVISTIARKKKDFCVLSGDDGLTLPLIAAGGDGVISVVSNLAPAEVTKLTMAALNGDMDTARELHYRLLPFFKAAFCDGNPTSIKYAMNYKGLPAGGLRLPLVEANENAKKTIQAALAECGL